MSRSPSGRLTKTRRWRRLRRLVLGEAGWRCEACGRWANEVDHIQPIGAGGERWERDNLQALCRSCHIEKTRKENRKALSAEAEAWRELVSELMPKK